MKDLNKKIFLEKDLNILYIQEEDVLEDVNTLIDYLSEIVDGVVIARGRDEAFLMYERYQQLNQKHYDVVIANVDSQVSICLEMAREMKRTNKDQIIALFTKTQDPTVLIEAVNIGINKIIVKPIVDRESFIKDVHDLCAKAIYNYEMIQNQFLYQQKDQIIDDYVYMTVSDLQGNIVDISQAYLDFTGYTKDFVIGKNHNVLKKHNEQPEKFVDLWTTISEDKVWRGEIINHKKSGEEFIVDMLVSPVFDKYGDKVGYKTINQDVTDKYKLRELSSIDALTGLHNRRAFDHYLRLEFKRSSWKKETFALLMIDIDKFTKFNTVYGKEKSDSALEMIGHELASSIGRDVNAMFRVGGDEFAAVIINKDNERVQEVCDNIIANVNKLDIEFLSDGQRDNLGISIGAVNLPSSEYNINCYDLYNVTDANLNEAKKEAEHTAVLKLNHEYVNDLTDIDSNTKLPNRQSLIHDISLPHEDVMLILLHYNQIKMMKELYGLSTVQELICREANRIEMVISDADVALYSLNLQEFAILITNKNLFDKYLSLLEFTLLLEHVDEDTDISLSLTAGVAIGIGNVFNDADVTLQEAILEKVKFKIFQNNLTEKQEQKASLERLRIYQTALHSGNIIPYFQPILDARDETLLKYEALARIITEEGEIISPYYFLDAAKEDMTFEYFTRQMLQKVFNIYGANKGIDISVNLTYENISSPSMVNYIKNRLDKYGGSGMTFEIVESEDIKDYKLVEDFVLLVKSYGCEVSIDDFGSGYSNLTNILRLNIDYIKLDGSLVQKLDTDEKSRHMVEGLLIFAKNAGIKTIAEFVATKQLADLVKSMGIDYLQGYYYGEPKEPREYNLS